MSESTQEERERFWNAFKSILVEQHNPFTICERQQYAAINLSYPTTRMAGPILEFLYKGRTIRTSIYIVDDKKTPCYDRMYADKDVIERRVGKKLIWKNGVKNSDAKRIQYECLFNYADIENGYKDKIEELIPIAEKIVKIADDYIPSGYRG